MKQITGKLFIIGGYGNIGHTFVEASLNQGDFDYIIAGPNINDAENLCQRLTRRYPATVFKAEQFNVHEKADYAKIPADADCVINCAGSFHTQNHLLPTYCAKKGFDYCDTALNSNYVAGIHGLNDLAQTYQTRVIAGCGVLPSLTTAIIDEKAKQFSLVEQIDIAYHMETPKGLGLSTLKCLLHECGKPIESYGRNQQNTRYAGLNLHRRFYGDNLGFKWQTYANFPENILLPQRFENLKEINTFFGTTPAWHNFIFWGLSGLVRFKVVPSGLWAPFSFFNQSGRGDCSALVIRMTGTSESYQPLKVMTKVIGEQGSGALLSALSLLTIVKKILQKKFHPGAYPAMHCFTVAEYQALIEGQIYFTEDSFEE